MEGLIDTRDEYIEHIQDILSVAISKRIYAIYTEMMGEKKGLKGFQNELYSIRKWNNNIVSDEYKKIVKYTKCKYLANLIKIIIITTIKIKIYEYREHFDNIKIKIPNAEDFVHRCYINAASFSWKNAYLYNRNNIKDAEYQNNLNIIEENIRAIVKKTFRDFIPFDEIFKQIEDNLTNNVHQYKDTDARSVDVEITKKSKKSKSDPATEESEDEEESEESEDNEDNEVDEEESEAEEEESEAEEAEEESEDNEVDDDNEESEDNEVDDDNEESEGNEVDDDNEESEAEAEDNENEEQSEAVATDNKEIAATADAAVATNEPICEDNKEDNKINNIVDETDEPDDTKNKTFNSQEISFANHDKDKEDATSLTNTIHKEWNNIKDEYSSLSHSSLSHGSLSQNKMAYKMPENESVRKKKYDNDDDDTISIKSNVSHSSRTSSVSVLSNITDTSQIKKIHITDTKSKKPSFF
uniref:Uncharacterized protein n=1 Tax=viral metagenome TaxID=1070528 RepID=A0A6C0LQE7_9ZZZZ